MERIHNFKDNADAIEVGEFTIRECQDGSFFISREDGEGMQVDSDALEECILAFYREHL